MIGYAITFVAALCATLALTPLAQALALRTGIVDCPDGRRKLQKRPVPLLGGVAVFGGWWLGLAFTLVVGLPLRFPAAMPSAALTMAALTLVGICDDACNLRARWKLLAQVLAAAPIGLSGCAMSTVAIFGYQLDLGSFGPALTVLWLVVGINALNLIDGMDGMASLTGLCICLGTAAFDVCTGGQDVAMFALGLAGALAGFLMFNFPPARIYLGDAGSMVIGLAVSLAALRVSRGPTGVTQLTPMLALLALPLADTSLAILRRSLSGRGIWNADRGHIHHRLLDRGLSSRRVLALVAGVSAVLTAFVLVCRTPGSEFSVWAAGALLMWAAVRWQLAGYHEWALIRGTLLRIAGSVRVSETTVLDDLTFESAFERLRASLAIVPLERLVLSLEHDGLICRQVWESERRRQHTPRVAFEVSSPESYPAACRLRVELPTAGKAGDYRRIEAVLWQFACFWASHPETVPSSVHRVHSAEGQAAFVRAFDAHSRAA